MSLEATRWAWSVRGLVDSERIVLLYLADLAGDDPERANYRAAYPSVDTIAAAVERNRKAVLKALAGLRDKGFIRSSGGGSRADVHTLLIDYQSPEGTTTSTLRGPLLVPAGDHNADLCGPLKAPDQSPEGTATSPLRGPLPPQTPLSLDPTKTPSEEPGAAPPPRPSRPPSTPANPDRAEARRLTSQLAEVLRARGLVVTTTRGHVETALSLVKRHGAEAVAEVLGRAEWAPLDAWPLKSGLGGCLSAAGYDALANLRRAGAVSSRPVSEEDDWWARHATLWQDLPGPRGVFVTSRNGSSDTRG